MKTRISKNQLKVYNVTDDFCKIPVISNMSKDGGIMVHLHSTSDLVVYVRLFNPNVKSKKKYYSFLYTTTELKARFNIDLIKN